MSETAYIAIISTVTFPTIAFAVNHFVKRIDRVEKATEDVIKKADGIVSNYLDRFESIRSELHDLAMDNKQGHADIMEYILWIKTNINEQKAKEQ